MNALGLTKCSRRGYVLHQRYDFINAAELRSGSQYKIWLDIPYPMVPRPGTGHALCGMRHEIRLSRPAGRNRKRRLLLEVIDTVLGHTFVLRDDSPGRPLTSRLGVQLPRQMKDLPEALHARYGGSCDRSYAGFWLQVGPWTLHITLGFSAHDYELAP